MNDVVKLSIDLYKGSLGQYSKDQANEVLRKAFIELNGGSEKIDYKAVRKHKAEFFEIIEQALANLVSEGLEDQFSDFAEVRNLALGDTNVFDVPNTDLFNVAVISEGNANLRRQRLDKGTLTVSTMNRGLKIYEEMNRFLAGRIDWVDMVSRVSKSYNNKIAEEVYNAIYNSFSGLTATYAVSSAYSEDTLSDLAQHVEAAAGSDVLIFGTKKALGKVTNANPSDNLKDRKAQQGFYGVVNGWEMREIKQAHKPGTDNFIVNDSFLLVVPAASDKMVKIVNEGDALMLEGQATADRSLEYTLEMRAGIAVLTTQKYGIYRLP